MPEQTSIALRLSIGKLTSLRHTDYYFGWLVDLGAWSPPDEHAIKKELTVMTTQECYDAFVSWFESGGIEDRFVLAASNFLNQDTKHNETSASEQEQAVLAEKFDCDQKAVRSVLKAIEAKLDAVRRELSEM
jgi:hypothetical protein